MDAALARVKQVMAHPLGNGTELLVDLNVDGKAAETWYEAK